MTQNANHDEAKIRHLEMIQGVVTRMASNSFALKALAVTLTAGVLAFSGATKSPSAYIVLAALAPALLFWGLDARYVRLEHLYRRLYDAVRRDQVDAAAGPFSMDFRPYNAEVEGIFGIAISWSVILFYVPIVAVLLVLAALLVD